MSIPIRKSVIAVGASRKGSSVKTYAYVTGVKFADGPGYKVKTFTHNPDPDKAMKFSIEAGEAIAQQLAASYDTVTLNGERVLRTKAQIDAAEAARKAAEELNDIFRSFGRSTYRKARGF